MYSTNDLKNSNLIYSYDSSIYAKSLNNNQINQYLIHYWPFNGNYLDVITNVSLVSNGQGKDSLAQDRFNRANYSLFLNYGYLITPAGFFDYYIYGDYTLTTWVKINKLDFFARFLALDTPAGDVIYSLTGSYCGPYLSFLNGDQTANSELVVDTWQHLAFTNKGTSFSIYIDGVLQYNGPTTRINFTPQSGFYLGSDGDHYVNASFDDIKIYNKSLNQAELIQSSLDNY